MSCSVWLPCHVCCPQRAGLKEVQFLSSASGVSAQLINLQGRFSTPEHHAAAVVLLPAQQCRTTAKGSANFHWPVPASNGLLCAAQQMHDQLVSSGICRQGARPSLVLGCNVLMIDAAGQEKI